MHSLTKDELAALLTAAKKHSQRDYVMVLVGFYHGMRASEVCGLTAEHIRDGYIRIERLKGSETNVQEAHPDVLAYAKGKIGLLFGIKRRQFFNVVRKHCVTAGIPEHLAHPHTLRHTCCSLMLDGGAKINEVQKRAGHRSLSSTGRYLVVSDAVASRAFQSAVGNFHS
jgi:type 1 fimbriae regulatory protein FimB